MTRTPHHGLSYLQLCSDQLGEFGDYREPMRTRLLAHGDLLIWEDALDQLGKLELPLPTTHYGPVVSANSAHPPPAGQSAALSDALKILKPWRKGPFELHGVHIDTEWRSDWKWARLAHHLPDMTDRRILDVGCGNGYYGWRMLGAGAREVIGIDPTLLFVYQYLATAAYLNGPEATRPRNWVLPLSFEELRPTAAFDLVFSMGVLYHRREPRRHLRALTQQLKPGGTLVLETLISRDRNIEPPGRYAQMRNVHCVPCIATVLRWLEGAGLQAQAPCDVTTTTIQEQRATDWMSFESLVNTLDPTDPSRTIEGHPAPVRACFVAKRPN